MLKNNIKMRVCPICNTHNNTAIYTIPLTLLDDIKLNNIINVYKCISCEFYYSDSLNTQEDYDSYYNTFNNYKNYINYSDKDLQCYNFLNTHLTKYNVNTILDYGSGNGQLSKLLSSKFNINEFDIGMVNNKEQYDCVILSHVLEHIYDIKTFINKIKLNLNKNGILYVEVPNVEFYDRLTNISPLQEINIEHINFFSKNTLNKLLSSCGFTPLIITDDTFKIKQDNYYVIRAIFKINNSIESLERYIHNSNLILNNYNFNSLKKYNCIYIYGCGQLLFKIFNKLIHHTNIVNIIDDNLCYTGKNINDISIIDFELYKNKSNNNDIILLTTLIYDNIIKHNIYNFNKNITVLTLNDL